MSERYDEEFDQIAAGYERDPHPYDTAPAPARSGLTKRGKMAAAVGAAVLVGGGAIGWSHYSAAAAEAEIKAQELELKAQELELKRIEALREVSASGEDRRSKDVKECIDKGARAAADSPVNRVSSLVEECGRAFSVSTDTLTAPVVSERAADGDGTGGLSVDSPILWGVVAVGAWAAWKTRRKAVQAINPAK